MKKIASLLSITAALAVLPLVGCETNRSASTGSTAGMTLEASSDRIVVGETVTFIARTYDTYGRDADIEWHTTSGKVETEQDGRVARVTFNDVGTYTVRATLTVDGRRVSEQLEEVRVVALR